MRRLIQTRLADPQAEQVRADHAAAIGELQNLPLAGARVMQNIEIADATTVYVPHGLGRLPIMMLTSPVRGATSTGRLVEPTAVSYDRRKYVALHAAGWGATITVDVLVI